MNGFLKKGRIYEAIRSEILDKDFDEGLVKEMERLSSKYSLPNVLLHFVRPRYISKAVSNYLKDRICHETFLRKTVKCHHVFQYQKPHLQGHVSKQAIRSEILDEDFDEGLVK